MPAGRYSAGRIFLQVVPSFKGFQREISREVNKANAELGKGLEKEAPKAARRAGQKSGSEFLMGFTDWTSSDQKKLQSKFAKALGDLDKLNRKRAEERERERARDFASAERWAQRSAERIRQVQARANAEELKASERFYRENIKQRERAYAEGVRMAEEADKAERDRMSRRGGAMRKELDRAIKGIEDSLGTLDLDKPFGRELDKLRRRAKQTGVEVSNGLIDMTTARRNLEAVGRDLDRLGRRGGLSFGNVDRGNLRAAVRDVRDMSRAMDDANRRGGVFSRFLRGATGDGQDGANAFRIFNYRVLAVVSTLPLLVPLLAAAAGGLVALSGAAVGAAAGLGVLILGFSGISDAVKAMGDVQDNAAKDALASGKALRTAARSVRDAGQGLARAKTQAARASEDSNRRIADAEKRLAATQRDAADAQNELRTARAAAQKDQQDLADKIAAGALDERQALIDLFEAQVAYNSAMASGGATNLEKEQLSINLERARLAIKGIRAENAGLRADQRKTDKAGIEGSDTVIAAKKKVTDSQEAQREAEQAVADARRDAAQQAVDNALAIRDAQERVTDAQEGYNEALAKTGEIGSASAQKLQDAMNKLGPEGQNFARFLFSMRDGFYELRNAAQKGLLPGVEDTLRGLTERYGPGLKRFVENMGFVLGDAFRSVGDALKSPVWESFFAMLEKNAPLFTETFVQTMTNLATGVAAILDAFAPVSVDFANAMVDISGAFADWAASLKDSEGFQKFLAYLEKTGPKVWELLGAIVGAFVNLGVAMAPFADKILDLFIGFFETIANMDPDTLALIASAILGFVLASQIAAGVMQAIITLSTPFHSVFGAIVFLLVGLGVALVYAYQHWDGFREVVDKVIGFIRRHQTVFAVLAGVIGTIGAALFGAFKVMSIFYGKVGAIIRILSFLRYGLALLGGPVGLVIAGIAALVAALVWAYNNVDWFRAGVDAGFKLIGQVATWLWENIFKPVFGYIWDIITAVGEVIWWLWSDVAGPVFELIGAIISTVWKKTIQPVLGWIGDKFSALGEALRLVYMNYINPVLDQFGLGVDDLKGIFGKAVDAMGKVWETLKESMAAPIRWIVDTVINKGFVDNFNKLADYFGTSKIPHLSLSFLDKATDRKSYSGKSSHGQGGYAMGGYTGPGAKYQPAGIVHADEFVIRKESTNRIRSKYGLNVLDYINRHGDLPGMGGYASGGLVALGKRLQSMGFAVSENPAFGGVNGSHSRTGWHYRGGAIDVNWPNGQRQSAEETAKINAILGLAKQYGVRTIWQYPNHYDHVHFDIDKGPDLGNFAGASKGRKADTPWWIEKPFQFLKEAVNGLMGKIPSNAFTNVIKGFPTKLLDFAQDKITELLAGTGDYTGSGDGGDIAGGVMQWRSVALQALARVGQPASLVDLVLRRMAQESGGNPRAINRWDSNALSGIPSKGLMQVIDPTFKTWRDPKLPNDVYNPMANLVASMRYAINRYGSLESAYGRPGGYAEGGLVEGVPDNGTMMYDNGGYLPPGVTQVVNLTGRPEPVFTAAQFDQMGQGEGRGGKRPLIGSLNVPVHGTDLEPGDVVGAIMWELDRVTHGGKYAGWTD